ncbi:lactadherin-like [Xenia sp. Carnegie-2017]|uniref:lactadherin-like n=1 Tax=Xenia sp. Carnegie-2017 TaxID=2897299 RepID=UPI001F047A03|nr:lactadherin-like [Xenia sp. Carnegie-2017]
MIYRFKKTSNYRNMNFNKRKPMLGFVYIVTFIWALNINIPCAEGSAWNSKLKSILVDFEKKLDAVKAHLRTKSFDFDESCNGELGMRNGLIGDSQLTASSTWDSNHGPGNARLFRPRNAPNTGAWSSRANNRNQWLQVNFLKTTKITGISIQGRPESTQWATSFSLSYSIRGSTFKRYRVNGNVKVFQANSDKDSVVHHKISPPIVASFIRIEPVSWHNHISLRAEFYGC